MDSAPPAVIAPETPALPSAPRRDVTVFPVQAHNDDHLVDLWLHGRSPGTQRAYAADVLAFGAHVGCTLPQVTLGGLQGFRDSLLPLATQARRMSAVKSLLSFGHRTGYLPVNVGAAVRLPKIKDTLAERILDMDAVLHMLALEHKELLRLLYPGGAAESQHVDQPGPAARA